MKKTEKKNDNFFDKSKVSEIITRLESNKKQLERIKLTLEQEYKHNENNNELFGDINNSDNIGVLLNCLLDEYQLSILNKEEIEISFDYKKMISLMEYNELLRRLIVLVENDILNHSYRILDNKSLVGYDGKRKNYEIILEKVISKLKDEDYNFKSLTQLFRDIADELNTTPENVKTTYYNRIDHRIVEPLIKNRKKNLKK